jgi:hypothetical protein
MLEDRAQIEIRFALHTKCRKLPIKCGCGLKVKWKNKVSEKVTDY